MILIPVSARFGCRLLAGRCDFRVVIRQTRFCTTSFAATSFLFLRVDCGVWGFVGFARVRARNWPSPYRERRRCRSTISFLFLASRPLFLPLSISSLPLVCFNSRGSFVNHCGVGRVLICVRERVSSSHTLSPHCLQRRWFVTFLVELCLRAIALAFVCLIRW